METDTSLNEEEILAKKKSGMTNELNQQAKICIILQMKDFEDKCLGTTHKIKSFICTVLP